MSFRPARILAAIASGVPMMMAAAADAPRRFAAPEVASAPSAGGATGFGQVMLALIVVLAAVFLAAMLVRRLRGFTGGGSAGIEVLSQTSLGAKERLVIVRVAGNRLLLGVASGQVNLLQTLPPEADSADATAAQVPLAAPRFTELLRRSLGK